MGEEVVRLLGSTGTDSGPRVYNVSCLVVYVCMQQKYVYLIWFRFELNVTVYNVVGFGPIISRPCGLPYLLFR